MTDMHMVNQRVHQRSSLPVYPLLYGQHELSQMYITTYPYHQKNSLAVLYECNTDGAVAEVPLVSSLTLHCLKWKKKVKTYKLAMLLIQQLNFVNGLMFRCRKLHLKLLIFLLLD